MYAGESPRGIGQGFLGDKRFSFGVAQIPIAVERVCSCHPAQKAYGVDDVQLVAELDEAQLRGACKNRRLQLDEPLRHAHGIEAVALKGPAPSAACRGAAKRLNRFTQAVGALQALDLRRAGVGDEPGGQ